MTNLAPRGVALLLALTLMTVLSAGAALLLTQAQQIGMFSGSRQNLLQQQQAGREGITLGTCALNNLVFADDAAPVSLSKIRALAPLARQDPICIDGIDCSTWYELVPEKPMNNDRVKVRIAATCNPGGCQLPESKLLNFQLRVHVTMARGRGQVTEVFLEPH